MSFISSSVLSLCAPNFLQVILRLWDIQEARSSRHYLKSGVSIKSILFVYQMNKGCDLSVSLAELTCHLWRTLLLTQLWSFLYPLLPGFPDDCDLGGVGDLWGHERMLVFLPPTLWVFSLRIMVATGAWGLLGKNRGPLLDHPQPASRKENPSLTWS